MGFVTLDALEDPRLAVFRHLKPHNSTRHLGSFVLEGEKLLLRLLESPQFQIESAVLSPSRAERLRSTIPSEIPAYVLDESLISQLVGFPFHLGVISSARRTPWMPVATYCEAAFKRQNRITLAVCPAVNDPENLGAIARIGDSFGIDGILAGPNCPDPLSRRVLRVSMGAVLRLPVWQESDLAQATRELARRVPLRLAACVAQPEATPLHEFDRPAALGLVFGNEAQGLPHEWVARCEDQLTIPMRSGADSLNVAVSAGIILHHVMR